MSNLTILLNLSIVGISLYLVGMAICFFADKSAGFVVKKKLEGFKEHCVVIVYLVACVTTILYAADGVFWLLGKVNGG